MQECTHPGGHYWEADTGETGEDEDTDEAQDGVDFDASFTVYLRTIQVTGVCANCGERACLILSCEDMDEFTEEYAEWQTEKTSTDSSVREVQLRVLESNFDGGTPSAEVQIDIDTEQEMETDTQRGGQYAYTLS